MDHKLILIIGIIASICSAISALPQLIKIAKEKKAEDISIPMLVLLSVGLSLWVTYGILRNDWIIIAANGFSVTVNLTIIALVLKYKK